MFAGVGGSAFLVVWVGGLSRYKGLQIRIHA